MGRTAWCDAARSCVNIQVPTPVSWIPPRTSPERLAPSPRVSMGALLSTF